MEAGRVSGELDVSLPRGVPWRGCALHLVHLPKPSRTHRHHRFPLFLQKRVYGRVVDETAVDVCPTGHDDVHAALDALLKGAAVPRGVGRRERDAAELAISLYRTALVARAEERA